MCMCVCVCVVCAYEFACACMHMCLRTCARVCVCVCVCVCCVSPASVKKHSYQQGSKLSAISKVIFSLFFFFLLKVQQVQSSTATRGNIKRLLRLEYRMTFWPTTGCSWHFKRILYGDHFTFLAYLVQSDACSSDFSLHQLRRWTNIKPADWYQTEQTLAVYYYTPEHLTVTFLFSALG